jgi:hypothetical protein
MIDNYIRFKNHRQQLLTQYLGYVTPLGYAISTGGFAPQINDLGVTVG